MTSLRIVAVVLAAGLAVAVRVAAAPAATPAGTPLATVHRFIDRFDRGNLAGAAATCAPVASVIDEFPPHHWHGRGACAAWAKAYAAYAKANGVTDAFVTLLAPWDDSIDGNRAYVVVPANERYRQRGKPAHESGSIFTVALERSGGVWRIVGWAWAGH